MEKISLTHILALIAGYSVKELISIFKGDSKKNTEATLQNTLALIELKVEITHLKATLGSLPKMQKDLNEAHAKIREMLAVQSGRMGEINDS